MVKMTHKTINLDEDSLNIIKGMKEENPNFSLSGFFRDKLLEEVSYFSPEEVKLKIKMCEITLKNTKKKKDNLMKALPIAIKRKESIKKTLQFKIKQAIKILKRKINRGEGEQEIIRVALVWEKITGIDHKELIRKVKL